MLDEQTHSGREMRTSLSGTIHYRYSTPEDGGVAQWRDVSRSGASILLGRYLRPGRQLTLDFPHGGSVTEVRARVTWCAAHRQGGFAAGLMVYRDAPETAIAFAALGLSAREAADAAATKECLRWALLGAAGLMTAARMHAQAV